MNTLLNTKRNRILSIIAAGLLLLALVALYFSNNKFQYRIELSSDYATIESADELISYSELILIGSTTQDIEKREHHFTYYPTGDIQDFYSITDFKISKIIKDVTPDKFQEGQIIKGVESFSIDKGMFTERLLLKEGYDEVQENEEHLLFFVKNAFGDYVIANRNLGKFTIEELNNISTLKSSEDKNLRQQMASDIINQFNNELKNYEQNLN